MQLAADLERLWPKQPDLRRAEVTAPGFAREYIPYVELYGFSRCEYRHAELVSTNTCLQGNRPNAGCVNQQRIRPSAHTLGSIIGRNAWVQHCSTLPVRYIFADASDFSCSAILFEREGDSLVVKDRISRPWTLSCCWCFGVRSNVRRTFQGKELALLPSRFGIFPKKKFLAGCFFRTSLPHTLVTPK